MPAPGGVEGARGGGEARGLPRPDVLGAADPGVRRPEGVGVGAEQPTVAANDDGVDRADPEGEVRHLVDQRAGLLLVRDGDVAAGEAVDGQSAQLELRRWNERSFDYSEVISRVDLTSNSSGLLSNAFTLARAGYYQIRLSAKGAQGHPATISTWAWAYAEAEARPGYASSFEVHADHDTYAPGDQAVLTIQSTFSGPALISIGRTGLLREQVVTLTAPTTQVSLPILPGDARKVA